jgi:hypothetical protein
MKETVGNGVFASSRKRVQDGVLEPGNLESEAETREAMLLSELLDCLTGAGNYAPESLNGARRAERFSRALDGLGMDERDDLVALLVSSVLGRLEASRWYARDALEVLVGLCALESGHLMLTWRSELEAALENAIQRGQRLQHRREPHPPRGRAFLRTWTYAIQLWQVITALHSPHSSRLLTALLRVHERAAPSRPTSWWMPRMLAC